MPKKLTTEEFIEKAKKVHENKYDYSKTIYIRSHNKIIITCPEHGDFKQTPKEHIEGHKCSECAKISRHNKRIRTKDEFINKANKKHDNKYDYSKVIYINSITHVIITCPIHGDFHQTPGHHLTGQQCPKCSGKNKTTEELIGEFKKIHGDKYDYSIVKYINALSKVKIICPTHGEFEQTPNIHLNGSGCFKCGNNTLTYDDFLLQANKIHNNKYVYKSINYKGNSTKMKIICPEHGEFNKMPYLHLEGQGCSKCAIIKKTTNDFINDAKKIHGNMFDYSKSVYIKAHAKIKIICKKHGVFKQTPNSHLKGQGCPICKSSKGEIEISKTLNKHNIKFQTQKKFEDCKNTYKLPFDFYLPDYNLCLEFDGRHHYQIIESFGGIEALKKTQKNDKIKTDYCTGKNGRPTLIRIRYDEDINEKLSFLF